LPNGVGVHTGSWQREKFPLPRHQLSDVQIRRAKPSAKPRKLFDGGGLFVLVHPNGSRYWRLKYRHGGRERLLALGVYPQVGLAEARERADEAKRLIATNVDPVHHRRAQRASAAVQSAQTFKAIAEEWIAARADAWSPSYADAVRSALAANLYPQIGGIPMKSITVPVIREALLLMEKRGALVALRKVRMWASGVFRYAIATGRAENDPAAPLRGTFKAHEPRNFPALTKAEELGQLMASIAAYDGSPITRAALKMLAYTFVRTGELRGAAWSEFDLEKRMWIISPERMKSGVPHIVPLSDQVVELLSELKLLTGTSQWLFPNERRPQQQMSENTILYALYRMGYHGRATGHGFRSSASTLLNEELNVDADVVERQLAHQERNRVRAAYHRATYLPDRQQMMQRWADFLDDITVKGRPKDRTISS
jgi:integrase